MSKGKAYANRKKEADRPKGDLYETPSCLVKELLEHGDFPTDRDITIYDPCCGHYAIGNVLRQYGYKDITEKDILYGDDFLADYTDNTYDVVIMNPPFKLFDKFVEKAKRIADEVYCIGKLNYFGTHDRKVKGFWDTLDTVYAFDRMIDYASPEDKDGKVGVGMMVTGWFYWKKSCPPLFPLIKVFDVQKYIRSSKDIKEQ